MPQSGQGTEAGALNSAGVLMLSSEVTTQHLLSLTHRLEDEHAVVGAQQLRQQQLEELLLQAASVDASLLDEVHPQRLKQVLRPLPRYLVQRVLQLT